MFPTEFRVGSLHLDSNSLHPNQNNVAMAQLPTVDTYRHIQKATFNQEKAKSIKEQLAIEQTAKNAFAKRNNENNFFLKYKRNPFTSEFHQKPQEVFRREQLQRGPEARRESQRNTGMQDRTLVEVMHQEGAQVCRELDHSILSTIEKYINIEGSIKEVKQVQKTTQQMYLNRIVDVILPERVKIEHQHTLEQIVAIKQDGFFKSRLKVDNLFFLVKGRDQEIKTGLDILQKHYFCQDSIRQPTSKKNKLSILRDISQFSRKCIRKLPLSENKIDILDRNQLSMGGDGFSFPTIMSIAAGRSSPEDVTRLLSNGNVYDLKEEESEAEESETIEEKREATEVATNFYSEHQVETLVKQLRDEPLISVQEKVVVDLKNLLGDIKCTINKMKNISKKQIKDKQMVDQLQNKKNLIVSTMVYYGRDQRFDSKEEKINYFKSFKNRKERLKNQSIIQAFSIHKQHKSQMRSTTMSKKGLTATRREGVSLSPNKVNSKGQNSSSRGKDYSKGSASRLGGKLICSPSKGTAKKR